MPADLEAAFARKRKAQSDKQTDTTMISVWVIIYLAVLVLLLADKSYAAAMDELIVVEEVVGLF
jgi:hypothetical protein